MARLSPPSLRVRLVAMIYEATLLFGVVFIAGWLFSTLLQQRNALDHRAALQVWLFLVLALYFVWFWSHGGQTLPMKTWRICLLTSDGQTVRPLRAAIRYVLAWGWFVPGLALALIIGAKGWMLVLFPVLNILIWAFAVFLDPQRQFIHDRLAGTRLERLDRLDLITNR
ncbi:MAG: RDD family protein [Janthinobacterium lividum]